MKPYIVRTKALLIVIVTAFLFICIVVSACSPIRTKVDLVDKRNNINYSSYRSYDIVPNEQLDLVGLPLDKANLDELITRTVHKQLQGNGFQRNKENPDFLVAYYIVTNTKTDVYYIDNYYSGAGYMPNRSSTRNSNLLMEDLK